MFKMFGLSEAQKIQKIRGNNPANSDIRKPAGIPVLFPSDIVRVFGIDGEPSGRARSPAEFTHDRSAIVLKGLAWLSSKEPDGRIELFFRELGHHCNAGRSHGGKVADQMVRHMNPNIVPVAPAFDLY